MSSTDFDIDALLGSTTTQPMSTRAETPPEGKALAKIASLDSPDDIKTKWIKAPKGGRTWFGLAIPFDVIDEAYLAKANRTKVRVYSDWQLDVDAASRLDASKGKNTKLGQLRAAVGQNEPMTEGFIAALQQLAGAGPVLVTIKADKDPQYVKVVQVDAAP
jgi:hypothetical protein